MFLLLLHWASSSISRVSAFTLASNLTVSSKRTISLGYGSHPLFLFTNYQMIPQLTLRNLHIQQSFASVIKGKSIYLEIRDSSFSNFSTNAINLQRKDIDSSISYQNGSLSIYYCSFHDIKSQDKGGAIYCENCIVSMTSSLISFCYADNGAAVYSVNTSFRASESNFTKNDATLSGGVFYIEKGTHVLSECLLIYNTANIAAGIDAALDPILRLNVVGFVANNADKGQTAISAINPTGTFRHADFIKNTHSEPIQVMGIVTILNPNNMVIAGCKFIDQNFKNQKEKPTCQIFIFGEGIASVRFCIFDCDVRDVIDVVPIKQDDLHVSITNCKYNSEIKSKYADLDLIGDGFEKYIMNCGSIYSMFAQICFMIFILLFIYTIYGCMKCTIV